MSILVYGAITLLIAYPLLGQGYVFALDHAMGPNGAEYYSRFIANDADPIQSKGGFAILLSLLDALMPVWVAQKSLLFLPYFLAGLGMHRLVRTPSAPLAYLGGFVYMLSPFAYIRGAVGQMGVLWAYALTPWFLHAWLRASEGNSRKALVTSILLLSATAVFQAHGAALMLGLAFLHTLVRLGKDRPAWRAALRPPLLLVGGFALLNAHWILPVLLSRETTLTRIGEGDFAFFAPTAARLPSVGLAALTLEGFWREGYQTYYDAARPWRLLWPIALLALTVHGARSRQDTLGRTLAWAGGIGFALGVGASASLTEPVFRFAWDHVPFFRGFRDSHKLLALLALAYAGLAPTGASDLLERVRRLKPVAARGVATVGVMVALLVTPVAIATPLLHGYGDQLRLSDYPATWAEAEASTADCDGRMLVFPWHLYLDLGFVQNADQRVVNPAKLYFSCPTLSSDNVEAGFTASQSPDPTTRYVERWLFGARLLEGNPRGVHTLGNLMGPAGVSHFLVLKESDWRAYANVLDQQDDVRLVLDNDDVRVYENLAPHAAAWRTSALIHIQTLDDLLPLSENRTLAGTVFTLDEKAPETPDGAREPLALGDAGLWPQRVRAGEGRYVTFLPPPGGTVTGWRISGGEEVGRNLGVAPVFDAPEKGWLVHVGTWVSTGLGWLVSAATLARLFSYARRSRPA